MIPSEGMFIVCLTLTHQLANWRLLRYRNSGSISYLPLSYIIDRQSDYDTINNYPLQAISVIPFHQKQTKQLGLQHLFDTGSLWIMRTNRRNDCPGRLQSHHMTLLSSLAVCHESRRKDRFDHPQSQNLALPDDPMLLLSNRGMKVEHRRLKPAYRVIHLQTTQYET